MIGAILRLQWRSARAWIGAALLAVVALPVLSVARSWPSDPDRLAVFLAELDLWSGFYPALAAGLGLTMAALTWRSDRQGDFVYALTLPIPRWHYVALRFVGGAAWLLGIAAMLWLAALVVVALTPVPVVLRAHPHALAAKFALATVSVYGLGFVLAALPGRVRAVGARVAALVVAGQVLLVLLGYRPTWLAAGFRVLVGPGGPLAALGGRWMLIDV